MGTAFAFVLCCSLFVVLQLMLPADQPAAPSRRAMADASMRLVFHSFITFD
ncbi:MAG: hypothetical protein ACTHNZ_07675 [Trinickia sp.]|jgi:hypothetical protein|uniref:hypothetical protein n=1 Tax=Trinickia sp. TaxID=2571163 RepID=UPI003F81C79D